MASYNKESRAGGSTAGTTTYMVVKHGECLRNYGVNEGRYMFDGCGEFINKGVEGTPDALICGACGCHRNFHRKIIEPKPPLPQQYCCPPGVPPLSLFRHHVLKRAAAKQSSQSRFQVHNNPCKEETLSE